MNVKKSVKNPAAVTAIADALTKQLESLRGQMATMQITIEELESKIEALEKKLTTSAPSAVVGAPVTQASTSVTFIEELEAINPEYVRLISGESVTYNSSNPMWSPRGDILAYEKSDEKKREIIIAEPLGNVIQQVSYKAAEQDMLIDELLSGAGGRVAYNAGMTWSSAGDRYVYMSNGGEGNYDLYLGNLNSTEVVRLTESHEKDGHADWLSSSGHVVYISSRTGSAQVFVLNPDTKETRQITLRDKAFFYPQWSPNGNDVIITYGDNDNHDIVLLKNVLSQNPEFVPITAWVFDDLRPKWSPDGKLIAFYSNYSGEGGDDKVWNLVVVNMEKPSLLSEDSLYAGIVATNVVPDVESGPAWMADSKNIVYVKKDEKSYNPLHVVNALTKTDRLINTNTKINHDVSCAANGQVAFRAQQDQWDRIFVMKLPAVVQ